MLKEIRKNKLKTVLFLLTFLLINTAVIAAISYAFKSPVMFIGLTLTTIIYTTVQYLTSTKTALKTLKTEPATPEDHPELYRTVENLSIQTGIPTPTIHIINHPFPNAFSAGKNPQNAAIGVTTGLLTIMNKNELEGVIAHEIAHIQNYDTRLKTVITSTISVLVALGQAPLILLTGSPRKMRKTEAVAWALNPREIIDYLLIKLLLLIALIPLTLLYITAIPLIKLSQAFISRERELLADVTATEITRYPEGLATALIKIGDWTGPDITTSKAGNSLYFASPNPTTKKAKLYATHPPTWERVIRLRNINSI